MLDLVSRLYLPKYILGCCYQSTEGQNAYGRCAMLCFLFKSMKYCEKDVCKSIKVDKILVHIRPRVLAGSPKTYIGVLLSIRRRIKHIKNGCNVMFLLDLIINCKNDKLL